MIELFRNLDIKLKDLIFKKKIQIYSLEKSNILALNQKLYDRENDLISKLNNQKKKIDIRKKLAKFENLQQLIGRRCNPLDLLSHVREFEDKYGKLDLLDEKTRIIGKEIDSIIKEVHLDLRNIDEKDKNIFFSIDNNSFDHYLPK